MHHLDTSNELSDLDDACVVEMPRIVEAATERGQTDHLGQVIRADQQFSSSFAGSVCPRGGDHSESRIEPPDGLGVVI